ncbi:aKG-HExxH-type peptide beta-hydroxylase [Streptomyces sp. NPDC086080]|uniref:aKG-HExxH-type peptide beta-hydroxylase n=1 Tax=Streptomyces sp. NPDC086080 TaxID=3365748 RepID=UPI0037D5EE11
MASEDLRLLDSARHSRLLLALVAIGTAQEATDRPDRRPADPHGPPTLPAHAWSLLCRIHRTEPRTVEQVLHDPTVSAWAFQLLRRLAPGAAATPADPPLWADRALLASVTGAAAIRSGTRCSLRVPARQGRLWLPTLGVTAKTGRGGWAVVGLETGPHGTVVFGDSGSVRLPDDLTRAADGWHPLPVIDVPAGDGGTAGSLVLDHLSPHRDYQGPQDPAALPPPVRKTWEQRVEAACELLRTRHADAHRLVLGTVRSLVPCEEPDPAREISVSVPDVPGLVAMSLPDEVADVAAALIHEANHQVMSSVGQLVPLLDPSPVSPDALFFAPWRDDPRPLRGLLLGCQAFAAMTSFWRACRSEVGERADFEFAFHRWQVRAALAALHMATGLSWAGAQVVRELARLNTLWWKERVGAEPERLAALCCRDLRASWRLSHLGVRDGEAEALAERWTEGAPPPAVLPAGRLGTTSALPAVPPTRHASRLWLARLWFTDRGGFADLSAALARGERPPAERVPTGLTAADCALTAGDDATARDRYAALLAAARGRTPELDVWTGLGLACAPRDGGLLAVRPELVLAVREALDRRGSRRPDPRALARWLAAGG